MRFSGCVYDSVDGQGGEMEVLLVGYMYDYITIEISYSPICNLLKNKIVCNRIFESVLLESTMKKCSRKAINQKITHLSTL